MKPKYHGIVTAVAFFMALLLAGGYYLAGLWRVSQEPGARPAAMAAGRLPDSRQVQRVERLMGRLDTLAVPRATRQPDVSLELFGQRFLEQAAQDAEDGSQDRREEGDHLLSMTLLAGAKRFCVLDGDFCTEGSRLCDGYRVQTIERKRVKIVKAGESRWLFLDDHAPASLSADGHDQEGPS